MKKNNIEIYVADFETSHKIIDNKHYAWVWVAGYKRIFSNKLHQQGNINDFVKSLFKNESKKVYFHNLKFDGQFLLSYFLAKGYKYSDKLVAEKQINYIIDDSGTFYCLNVSFLNNAGKLRKCSFLDSYKLYPFSLSTIAKQMNLSVQKGEMDYDIVRYKNHKLTESEQDYFNRDIDILQKAIEQAYIKGYKKLTIGANALAEYKSILFGITKNKYSFIDLFPPLDEQTDSFIRKAYKGGCCMLKSGIENKITDIHSYDINSMYPTMLLNCEMPYGKPKYFKGKWVEKEHFVAIQRLKCRFSIKPNYLPTVQLKGSKIFPNNEWIKKCPYQIELTLTNIDLKLLFEHYNVYDVEFIDGYEIKAHKGLFKDYIKKWYSVKQNTKDDGERLFSKLFLNNIYGKFGTNPCRKSNRYSLVGGYIVREETVETSTQPIYLPVAVFTTAYAREYLLKYAQMNYDKFLYCDTDSIHLSEPTNNLPIDNSKLGYFKYEYFGKAKHLKQKTYIVYVEKENKFNEWKDINKFKIVCAGMNQDAIDKKGIKLNFDNFNLGMTFPKMKLKRAIGGVYLSEEPHTLK